MKKLAFLVFLILIMAVWAEQINSQTEEFELTPEQILPTIIKYSIKPAIDAEDQGIFVIFKNANPPLANYLLKVPGVRWVIIKKHSIEIQKESHISEYQLTREVSRILKLYFRSKIVIA